MISKQIPKSIKIVYDKNSDKLARKAGKFIGAEILKNLSRKVLLLTSGGSAFKILDYLSNEILSKNLTASVLDERYSNDLKINNFKQLKRTNFYKRAKAKKVNFINTEILKNETMDEAGKRFDRNLKVWKQTNPKGFIIATMGIGDDGHTAGIMPYPENPKLFKSLFENKDKWAVGYDAGTKTKYGKRITTTASFIQHIVHKSIFIVTGENKSKILSQVFGTVFKLEKLPSNLIHKLKNTTLFTDINLKL